jgi:peptide/nickel transport system substrate-binding protein
MRIAFALFLALLSLAPDAKTLRWSSQGDYLTADPHAQNEGINNLINDEIFERLTYRDKQMRLAPRLATSWEQKTPTLWTFHIRKGVTFHDGTPMTAADVVFSILRAQLPSSNFKVFAVPVGKPRQVDDYTIEIETPAPVPGDVFLQNLDSVRIMSRVWCEKHNVTKPQDFKSAEETYASRVENGTGPYMLVKREAEVATVLRKYPGWWGIADGRVEGNVDEVVYRPIKSDATRMAALLSGEIDLVLDPPLQDLPRLEANPQVRVVQGPENRVIFLVMDQDRDALKYSNVKDRNPFKDLRVRQALYMAIDIEGIKRQVMRGNSVPTGSMIPSPSAVFPELEPRLFAYDPGRAKKLLADAGYPSGFEMGLLCPNNRYVNDERICIAIAGMLAKIGVTVNVEAIPRAQFFQRVDNFDVSMHLYGWGGAATDPGFTLTPVIHGRTGGGKGDFNSGRYKDEALDRMIDGVESELDPVKRRALMLDAFRRMRENIYTIPLHRQMIPWAERANVHAFHRPDNVVEALWVKID